MKSYIIKTCSEPIDWSVIERAELSECIWSPNPAPEAYMQAAFIPIRGLVFHLVSLSPPSRAENWEPDSSVWEDSCLEAFLCFDGKNYINMETNSNSAMLCAIGPDRNDRRFLSLTDCELPQVSAVESSEGWEIYLFLPSETVEQLYGIELKPGLEFTGNFYSCGDLTPAPHYAAWNSVQTETPDFHRPEYFGKLIIA